MKTTDSPEASQEIQQLARAVHDFKQRGEPLPAMNLGRVPAAGRALEEAVLQAKLELALALEQKRGWHVGRAQRLAKLVRGELSPSVRELGALLSHEPEDRPKVAVAFIRPLTNTLGSVLRCHANEKRISAHMLWRELNRAETILTLLDVTQHPNAAQNEVGSISAVANRTLERNGHLSSDFWSNLSCSVRNAGMLRVAVDGLRRATEQVVVVVDEVCAPIARARSLMFHYEQATAFLAELSGDGSAERGFEIAQHRLGQFVSTCDVGDPGTQNLLEICLSELTAK